MKKLVIGIIVVVIIAIIVGAIVMSTGKGKQKQEESGVKIQTAQQMQDIMNGICTKLQDKLPQLEVRQIDVTDELTVSATTGLQTANNVESLVVCEPFISSQAFSAVLVKTSENANIEEMKQQMLNNIDTRKWICVSAEKVWVTNSDNVIFLVMSSEEWGKPVYDEFKNAVNGKIGKELERTEPEF